ncbi:hypothetical protein [Rhizobium sp. 1399]|uniref:hypothetical protein n=1 Tax=Rhizobium sp. 1399 TaxID=2817758 RepID=UPI00285A3C95|nr:hypothetical protein [Rhizobium sp. 1399]MDR6670176.1 hypothetical protein [Rhizobium sp. 1399]
MTEIDLKPTSITVASKNCATDWRDDEVTGQKEQVRADTLALTHWRNERRRQIQDRAYGEPQSTLSDAGNSTTG